MSREYFSRFYYIEESSLSSYVKRFPYEINFESLQSIAKDTVDQREWGLSLIEPNKNNWGVIFIKEVELNEKMTSIETEGDFLTVYNDNKKLSFRLDIKDTMENPNFSI